MLVHVARYARYMVERGVALSFAFGGGAATNEQALHVNGRSVVVLGRVVEEFDGKCILGNKRAGDAAGVHESYSAHNALRYCRVLGECEHELLAVSLLTDRPTQERVLKTVVHAECV